MYCLYYENFERMSSSTADISSSPNKCYVEGEIMR